MENKNIYQKLFEVKKAGIKLQRDTKAFNYQYATLDQIQKKLWEVLQKQWLLVIHTIENNIVHTFIRNVENEKEFVYSGIPLTEWTKPQDKGSEITYYRRYNLLSLLDLEVEDDDGKKAQDSKPKEEEVEKPWYNDFETHEPVIIERLKNWETAKDIITKLTQKYKVNKKIRQSIEDLESDNK